MQIRFTVLFLLLSLLSISTAQTARKHTGEYVRLPGTAVAAMQKIDPERIRAHVRYLSHDLLEGRGTGQAWRRIAAEYIGAQFALYV